MGLARRQFAPMPCSCARKTSHRIQAADKCKSQWPEPFECCVVSVMRLVIYETLTTSWAAGVAWLTLAVDTRAYHKYMRHAYIPMHSQGKYLHLHLTSASTRDTDTDTHTHTCTHMMHTHACTRSHTQKHQPTPTAPRHPRRLTLFHTHRDRLTARMLTIIVSSLSGQQIYVRRTACSPSYAFPCKQHLDLSNHLAIHL